MNCWKKLLTNFTALLVVLSLGTSVIADDHDDDDEKHEHQQKEHDYDHDDEEDDEYDDDDWDSNQQSKINQNQRTGYWNIWSREPLNNPADPLPISTPTEYIVTANNKKASLYLIPQEGQLLVSAKAIADLLEARFDFHPQSKICVMSKTEQELIVRAGSNAAYENRIKTPMPTKAEFFENSVYLPISVAANSLGYRVLWDEENNPIILQSI